MKISLINQIYKEIEKRKKDPSRSENVEYLTCKRCKQSTPIATIGEKNEFKRLHANHNVSLWNRILEKIK